MANNTSKSPSKGRIKKSTSSTYLARQERVERMDRLLHKLDTLCSKIHQKYPDSESLSTISDDMDFIIGVFVRLYSLDPTDPMTHNKIGLTRDEMNRLNKINSTVQ